MAKFVCAILVVMIHIAPFGSTEEKNMLAYLNFGIQKYIARIAVPFFFISSGFFLFKKIDISNFSIKPIKKYVIHIVKLYMIWTVLYFPLVLYGNLKLDRGFLYSAFAYIRNIFFVGSYTHLWYLNATIFAVVLISLLLYKKVTPKKILIFSAGCYFIGLFAQSWFGFLLPLKEWSPFLWNILKLVEKVIVTTRNGLFEGCLFVSMGMCFAFFPIQLSKKKAGIGFLVSMIAMFLEVFLLQTYDFIREYDMYFFLVFTSFFFFQLVKEIQLPNHPIYQSLRILSSLIYYIHLWVNVVVGKVLGIVCEPLADSSLRFIITLSITMICAFILMKLSKYSKWKWLRNLYV